MKHLDSKKFELWKNFLYEIRGDHHFLAAILTEVGVEFDEDSVKLAAPVKSFAGSQLRARRDLRIKLKSLFKKHFGNVSISIIDAHPSIPARPSLGLVERRIRIDLRNAAIDESRKDSKINLLLRLFSGKIESVDPIE